MVIDEIRVFASAKINLNLKVFPVRKDGFHSIESIFQTVDLKDELTVRKIDGKGSCVVQCEQMDLPENNTIVKAYQAFCAETGIDADSVSVELKKMIPSGGGLGGGSSDAAAIIMALEKMYHIKLSCEQLDGIASVVGSDVFFFMHCDNSSDGCAVVTGRGDFVSKIKKRWDLHIVLAFPQVSSSTKEAYALIDEKYAGNSESKNPGPELKDLEAVYNLPVGKWNFVNDFTDLLVKKYPEIGACLDELRSVNSLFTDMSGSGSTVFGIFASREEAEVAVAKLKSKGKRCILVQ